VTNETSVLIPLTSNSSEQKSSVRSPDVSAAGGELEHRPVGRERERRLCPPCRRRRPAREAVAAAALRRAAGEDGVGLPDGSADFHLYPVNGPDLRRAKRIAGPVHATAVMYTPNVPPWVQEATCGTDADGI
jgi:hypothetical protein